MSRGVSVSPLFAQVFPCLQLVGGGKVLENFRPIVAKVRIRIKRFDSFISFARVFLSH